MGARMTEGKCTGYRNRVTWRIRLKGMLIGSLVSSP
jgi:hypothetical protein